MSWASLWWSRDSRDLWWRHGWSKGGTTIIRAHDGKRRIGNTAMSAGMSKSVNTNFIQKSFLLNIVNRHKGVIAQIQTEHIKIQSVGWVCGIHGYFVSVELFKMRMSQNLKHFQWMYLGRCPVTRRVASQCECKGASAWVMGDHDQILQ